MSKIAVTGYKGFLGKHLVKAGCVPVDVNILDLDYLRSTLIEIGPRYLIHAAALTDVNYCEDNPKQAFAVNVRGTMNVAEICNELSCKLIYLSTCHVFDGKHFYDEKSKPNPLNVYGFTKWQGEKVVETVSSEYMIVRASKLYDDESISAFVEKFVRNCSTIVGKFVHNDVDVFSALLYRSYTYAPHFVDKLLSLLPEDRKICHICSTSNLSEHDFFVRQILDGVFDVSGIRVGLDWEKTVPDRPKFGCLDSIYGDALFNGDVGIRMVIQNLNLEHK